MIIGTRDRHAVEGKGVGGGRLVGERGNLLIKVDIV